MKHYSGLSRETVKLIACLSMLVDHIGLVFFPGLPWLRVAGRLSFPIFACLIADGMYRTRRPGRMLLRLFLFSLASQVPYSLALYGQPFSREPNAGFTLTVGALFCFLLRSRARCSRSAGRALAVLGVPAAVAAITLPVDYGPYGFLLIAGFYLLLSAETFRNWPEARQRLAVFLFLALAGLYYALANGSWLQCWAPAAALFVPYDPARSGRRRFKRAFYCVYPAHLLLLWLVKLWR